MKMDGYSTHQSLLVAAIAATDGDILEIGGGWYSTPLITAMATPKGRLAFTFETGDFVYNILKIFNSPTHSVEKIDGFDFDEIGKFKHDGVTSTADYIQRQTSFLDSWWKKYTESGRKLSVVFVDQAPGALRVPAINFFSDKSDFIIAHDTEHVKHYNYEPTLSKFKSRWDFNLHTPTSVIMSNTLDCSQFQFLKPGINSEP